MRLQSLNWRVLPVLLASTAGCGTFAQTRGGSADRDREAIIALERSALDRWITGNPQGYLDLYVPEVTYFDPFRERRVTGLDAMKEMLAPMKEARLPFTNPRYELIEPRTQHYGEIVVLTFNLVNYGRFPNRPESVLSRWNATEVYRRRGGAWKIVHSHWSFVQPEVKTPGS